VRDNLGVQGTKRKNANTVSVTHSGICLMSFPPHRQGGTSLGPISPDSVVAFMTRGIVWPVGFGDCVGVAGRPVRGGQDGAAAKRRQHAVGKQSRQRAGEPQLRARPQERPEPKLGPQERPDWVQSQDLSESQLRGW
jgi:hypothetical protein